MHALQTPAATTNNAGIATAVATAPASRAAAAASTPWLYLSDVVLPAIKLSWRGASLNAKQRNAVNRIAMCLVGLGASWRPGTEPPHGHPVTLGMRDVSARITPCWPSTLLSVEQLLAGLQYFVLTEGGGDYGETSVSLDVVSLVADACRSAAAVVWPGGCHPHHRVLQQAAGALVRAPHFSMSGSQLGQHVSRPATCPKWKDLLESNAAERFFTVEPHPAGGWFRLHTDQLLSAAVAALPTVPLPGSGAPNGSICSTVAPPIGPIAVAAAAVSLSSPSLPSPPVLGADVACGGAAVGGPSASSSSSPQVAASAAQNALEPRAKSRRRGKV